MSDAEDRRAADSAAPLDIDLYCLNCGYNLRGLPGDPIRCPECGCLNPVRQLPGEQAERPKTPLERTLEELGQCASLCVIAVGVIVLVGALALLVGELFVYVWQPLLLTAGAVWLLGCVIFGLRCRGVSGWGWDLIRYHVYAVPSVAINIILVIGGTLVGGLLFGLAGAPGLGLVAGLGGSIVLIMSKNPMRWFNRRAQAALTPLARELLKRSDQTGHSEDHLPR